MNAPIDGSDSNPFPPPPDGWRPRELVQAEWAPLESALRERIERTALARRCTVPAAAALVLAELAAPVLSDAPMRERFSPSRLPPETGYVHPSGKR